MFEAGQRNRLSARAIICLVGLASMIWGVYAVASLWWPTSLDRTAAQIIQGNTFQGDAIAALASSLDDLTIESYPRALRSAAIIRLRALEKSMAEGGSPELDEEQRKLDASIRRSLALTPADPFLWVVLFWLENARNGFSQSHLRFLQASYALGPNEGWVAVRRNRLALAIFPQLPPGLRPKVIREFAGLVQSGFIAQAANLLVGPGWPVRQRLLVGLRDVPQIPRERLAKAVRELGYDVSVPGVKPPAPRPWR